MLKNIIVVNHWKNFPHWTINLWKNWKAKYELKRTLSGLIFAVSMSKRTEWQKQSCSLVPSTSLQGGPGNFIFDCFQTVASNIKAWSILGSKIRCMAETPAFWVNSSHLPLYLVSTLTFALPFFFLLSVEPSAISTDSILPLSSTLRLSVLAGLSKWLRRGNKNWQFPETKRRGKIHRPLHKIVMIVQWIYFSNPAAVSLFRLLPPLYTLYCLPNSCPLIHLRIFLIQGFPKRFRYVPFLEN